MEYTYEFGEKFKMFHMRDFNRHRYSSFYKVFQLGAHLDRGAGAPLSIIFFKWESMPICSDRALNKVMPVFRNNIKVNPFFDSLELYLPRQTLPLQLPQDATNVAPDSNAIIDQGRNALPRDPHGIPQIRPDGPANGRRLPSPERLPPPCGGLSLLTSPISKE